jgi:hypothetical protein
VEDLYIYKGQIGEDESIKHAMAGTFTFIYCCEESIPIWGILHHTPWELIGKNDRSVAHPAEYFFGGAPAVGTCIAARQLSGGFQGFTDWSRCSCGESSAT